MAVCITLMPLERVKARVIIREKVPIVSPSRVIFRRAGWQLLSKHVQYEQKQFVSARSDFVRAVCS